MAAFTAAAAAVIGGQNDAYDNHRGTPTNSTPDKKSGKSMSFFRSVVPQSPMQPLSPNSRKNSGFSESSSPSMSQLEKELAEEEAKKEKAAEPPESFSHRLVESFAFKGIITTAVMVNAVLMGLEADHPEWKDEFKRIDHVFGAMFFLEMLIKWVALRAAYFNDRWNLLDMTLAIMGFMDTWFITIVGGNNIGLSQFSILRILRLLRLVRLARLFKQFSKLIIVMRSIKDAIETTFWVACVLVICIYVCAIFCVDFIGRAEEGTYPGFSKDSDEIDQQEVMQNFNPHITFGSMGAAMCSLFNIAILAEWTEIVRPVFLKQPPMVLFFIAFMCFVCFGVMNVIIGMIVDSTIQHARDLEREHAQANKRKKVHVLTELKQVIFNVDATGDAEIDMTELETFLTSDDSRMKCIMDKVSLPYGCSPDEFRCLLDADGSGHLKQDEFIQSLYRLVNCTGFQQMCLIQIGITRIMESMNSLAGDVKEIKQQAKQQPSSPSGKKPVPSPARRPVPAELSTLPTQVPSPAPVQASDAAPRDVSAAPDCQMYRAELPDLAIRLDAVCEEVSRAVRLKLGEELTQVREELTQTLERVRIVEPKDRHVDDASMTGKWEVMEDKNRKIAVPVADAAITKSSTRVRGTTDRDNLDVDIANALVVGQPVENETYPVHAPEAQCPVLDTHRAGGDAAIDNHERESSPAR